MFFIYVCSRMVFPDLHQSNCRQNNMFNFSFSFYKIFNSTAQILFRSLPAGKNKSNDCHISHVTRHTFRHNINCIQDNITEGVMEQQSNLNCTKWVCHVASVTSMCQKTSAQSTTRLTALLQLTNHKVHRHLFVQIVIVVCADRDSREEQAALGCLNSSVCQDLHKIKTAVKSPPYTFSYDTRPERHTGNKETVAMVQIHWCVTVFTCVPHYVSSHSNRDMKNALWPQNKETAESVFMTVFVWGIRVWELSLHFYLWKSPQSRC